MDFIAILPTSEVSLELPQPKHYLCIFFQPLKMGFEASNERSPSPSPLDRSQSIYGNDRGGFQTSFDNMSRKKWTALALSVVLIVALLIAIIVLASTKQQPIPDCAKNNSSSRISRIGDNDALQGGPVIEESRMRGAEDDNLEEEV